MGSRNSASCFCVSPESCRDPAVPDSSILRGKGVTRRNVPGWISSATLMSTQSNNVASAVSFVNLHEHPQVLLHLNLGCACVHWHASNIKDVMNTCALRTLWYGT